MQECVAAVRSSNMKLSKARNQGILSCKTALHGILRPPVSMKSLPQTVYSGFS